MNRVLNYVYTHVYPSVYTHPGTLMHIPKALETQLAAHLGWSLPQDVETI